MVIACVLCLPALLLNLGIVPFIEDEGIRSLVAFEMVKSGEWITPKLNGELYFKKPPLYNWIIAFSHFFTGKWNEWSSRLPTVFFTLIFSGSIYFSFRKNAGIKKSLILAGMFLTCGRVLFWDSMLALIDICFSWVMFLMLINIFHTVRNRNWTQLYFGSYILCAVGFLLKSLPALVFLGLSIATYLLAKGYWKKLFCWQHFVAFGLFLLLLGSYYIPYVQLNGWNQLISTMWSENVDRTILEHGIWDVVEQLALFPLEMLYHFLPWSGLIFFAIRKDFIKWLRSDDLRWFAFLIFAVNILVYWTSPIVYPRYLFALAPFYFYLGLEALDASKRKKIILYTCFLITVFISVGFLILPYYDRVNWVSFALLKGWVLAILSGTLCWLYFKNRSQYLLIFTLHLLLLRIGFNFFVLPQRATETWGSMCRSDARRIGLEFRDKNLNICGTKFRYESSFYIAAEQNRILFKKNNIVPDSYCIVSKEEANNLALPIVDSLRIRNDDKIRYIIYQSEK